MRRPENGLGPYPVVNREPTKKELPSQMPIRMSHLIGSFRDPIYEELVRDFSLEKQQKKRQLTWIEALIRPPTFENPLDTRWDHTLQVTALTEAILRQNKGEKGAEWDKKIKTGVVAAWVHDIATPAFGDVSMKVEPDKLDEEANWEKVIGEEGYAFFDRHGLDPAEITTTIVNGGILGEVLDIADRIAYTTSDIYRFQHGVGQDVRVGRGAALLDYAAEHPDVGDIYKDVRVQGDQVYFENPERLAAFLKMRALLRRDFVEHPETQGRDIAIGNLIRRYLEQPGGLTLDRLREMGDIDLFHFFADRNQAAQRHVINESHPDEGDYYRAESSRSVYQQFVQFAPDYKRYDSQQALNGAADAWEAKPPPNTFFVGKHICE